MLTSCKPFYDKITSRKKQWAASNNFSELTCMTAGENFRGHLAIFSNEQHLYGSRVRKMPQKLS